MCVCAARASASGMPRLTLVGPPAAAVGHELLRGTGLDPRGYLDDTAGGQVLGETEQPQVPADAGIAGAVLCPPSWVDVGGMGQGEARTVVALCFELDIDVRGVPVVFPGRGESLRSVQVSIVPLALPSIW